MKTVYIVTSKPFFTPGIGRILGVFSDEDLAHDFIEQTAPDAWYDEPNEVYRDEAECRFYDIERWSVANTASERSAYL